MLKAQRSCSEPGCTTLTDGRPLCDAHAARYAQRRDDRRGSQRIRGYTRRWESERAWFLEHYPLCGMRPHDQAPVMSECFTAGRVTAGYQVDHVVPHKGNPGLFWDITGNWQTLCAVCGAKKTAAGL